MNIFRICYTQNREEIFLQKTKVHRDGYAFRAAGQGACSAGKTVTGPGPGEHYESPTRRDVSRYRRGPRRSNLSLTLAWACHWQPECTG